MAQGGQQASPVGGYTCTTCGRVVRPRSPLSPGQSPTAESVYTAHETQQDPMKRLLFLALTAVTLLMGTSASACEKHLNGHQNGSDTDLEGSKK